MLPRADMESAPTDRQAAPYWVATLITPFSFSYFLHQLERPAPTRWAFRVCALKLLHHPCRGAHCAPANLTLHRLFHVSAP